MLCVGALGELALGQIPALPDLTLYGSSYAISENAATFHIIGAADGGLYTITLSNIAFGELWRPRDITAEIWTPIYGDYITRPSGNPLSVNFGALGEAALGQLFYVETSPELWKERPVPVLTRLPASFGLAALGELALGQIFYPADDPERWIDYRPS